MADKDDDRDRDSDAPEEKKPEKKSSKAAAKSAPADLDALLVELTAIRKLLQESKEQHYPHLWLLFPIAAAVLIQAIFMAVRL